MEEYKKVHTKKNLYICPSRGWCKSYTTKGALKAHMVIHEDKTFLCPECGKSFNMKPNLDQHRQGKHLGRWVATCGKRYQWPAPMHHHERLCLQCRKIEQKQKDKLSSIWEKIILRKKGHKSETFPLVLLILVFKNFIHNKINIYSWSGLIRSK